MNGEESAVRLSRKWSFIFGANKYSSNSTLDSNFPKDIAETLASTLASDICVEIYFDDNRNPTHIELEECDYDDEDDD